MTWHLKDRELEKKLNELSNGEFSKNLHELYEDIFASYFGKTVPIKNYSYCTEGGDDEPRIERIPKFGFYFTKDELEEVPEYNPNDWNEFPTVKPPEDIWMRIESKDGWGAKAKWTGSSWLDCNKWVLIEKEYRFRPWEN